MLSTTAKRNMNEVKDTANDLRGDLESTAHRAGRKARKLLDTATTEINHAGTKVVREVRTNPVRSSVIALGIGAVLGALLRR